jgi:hypothetical protein
VSAKAYRAPRYIQLLHKAVRGGVIQTYCRRIQAVITECDVIDFVAAAVSAAFGVLEQGIFVENLVDRCAPTHGIELTEHVVEIAKQQGRYGLRHGFSPFDVECAMRFLDSGRLR